MGLVTFLSRVSVTNASECWLWTGTKSRKGYGAFGGRFAHRISHEAFVGPIPDGYHVDHLCKVRACVNPLHLEAVTPYVNYHRSHSWSVAGKCRKRGHDITDPANVYWTFTRGITARNCVACRNITRALNFQKHGINLRYAARVLEAEAQRRAA